MKIEHIKGKNVGKVFLYTLSTCGWCKKTKAFLNELGLEYSYVDIDLVPENEEDEMIGEVKKWNPQCSFPTIVINDKDCVVGFQPDRIKQFLGI